MPKRSRRDSAPCDASISVSFKYVWSEEEASKKAAIMYIVRDVLANMKEVQNWTVEIMDNDLDSRRKSILAVDQNGLAFHYSVGQLRQTEENRDVSDEETREKNTVVFVWDKFDMQDHCMKYIGLIQKYSNNDNKCNNKNVVVLLMPGSDKVHLDFSLSNSVPKARFLRFSRSDAFDKQLQAMILKPSRKNQKMSWRYENAVKGIEYVPFSDKRLKSANEDVESSDFKQCSDLLNTICSGVSDTTREIRNNNDLLQEILGKIDSIGQLPSNGISTGQTPNEQVRLLFMKIVGRIRVHTRLFLRTLIPDDNVIDAVEQKYGVPVGQKELNDEVLYRCLCYWAVYSTRDGMTQEEQERQLNVALSLSGNLKTTDTEMTKRRKEVLNLCREYLTDQICDLEALCIYLQSTKDIVETHKRYVLQRTTLTGKCQVDYLIDLLLTREDSAYTHLLTFLTEQGQIHIVEKLVEMEQELAPEYGDDLPKAENALLETPAEPFDPPRKYNHDVVVASPRPALFLNLVQRGVGVLRRKMSMKRGQ